MCLRPFLTRIVNTLGKPILIKVNCNKCPECLESKRRELAIRLQYDTKSPRCFDSIFFTLTYSDENLEQNLVNEETGEYYPLPSVNKVTMQNYLKRVRKTLHYDHEKTALKYYITGEYGATKRPHYHGIIYLLGTNTCKTDLKTALFNNWHLCDWQNVSKEKCFQSVNSEASQMYVAKHQVKRCRGTYLQAPYFQLRSKAIGSEFFYFYPQEIEFARKNGYLYLNNKYKVPIPRFFKEKLGLQTNYFDLNNIKSILQITKKDSDKELHEINLYLKEQYRKHPEFTQEQILDNYYKEKIKKDIYADKFFDIKYNKFSKTTNF